MEVGAVARLPAAARLTGGLAAWPAVPGPLPCTAPWLAGGAIDDWAPGLAMFKTAASGLRGDKGKAGPEAFEPRRSPANGSF